MGFINIVMSFRNYQYYVEFIFCLAVIYNIML